MPIIAATPNEATYRRLPLLWGVRPVLVSGAASPADRTTAAIHGAFRAGWNWDGQTIVIALGVAADAARQHKCGSDPNRVGALHARAAIDKHGSAGGSMMQQVIARQDMALMAHVIGSRPLRYTAGADSAIDRPAHVRAGSSLAQLGGCLVVVQDDANFIAIIDPHTWQVRAVPLPAGGGR